MAGQAVVVDLAGAYTGAGVGQLLQAKGVGGQRRCAAAGGALEHAVARRVVDVELLITTADAVLDHVVERVVGEGGRGTVVGAAGRVPPGVVSGTVERGALWFEQVVPIGEITLMVWSRCCSRDTDRWCSLH